MSKKMTGYFGVRKGNNKPALYPKKQKDFQGTYLKVVYYVKTDEWRVDAEGKGTHGLQKEDRYVLFIHPRTVLVAIAEAEFCKDWWSVIWDEYISTGGCEESFIVVWGDVWDWSAYKLARSGWNLVLHDEPF